MDIKQLDLVLHKLWTKAVDAPAYDKKEWIKLERGIHEIASQSTNSAGGGSIAGHLIDLFNNGGTVQDMMNYLNTRR